ncbi:hypothetical protein [Paractinoplanes hotanensis]|uniref:Uncharacterized protein n=1 Tax=Paractinoplanes hotanensis TaxID=2906497 RepID=A0ABT0Y592_9ACTN|nr:hypothetical protein [Actinoplanes hotanensis]MCM4080990.1 hypothetical protein [Actinoplanes hotanensis]
MECVRFAARPCGYLTTRASLVGPIAELSARLDAEIGARLPRWGRPSLIDPAVKAAEDGFAVLPRGSPGHGDR